MLSFDSSSIAPVNLWHDQVIEQSPVVLVTCTTQTGNNLLLSAHPWHTVPTEFCLLSESQHSQRGQDASVSKGAYHPL